MRTSNFIFIVHLLYLSSLPFELGFVYSLVATCLKRSLSFLHSFPLLFRWFFRVNFNWFYCFDCIILLRSFLLTSQQQIEYLSLTLLPLCFPLRLFVFQRLTYHTVSQTLFLLLFHFGSHLF